MEAKQALLPTDLRPNLEMPAAKIAGFFKQFWWTRENAWGPVTQVHVSRMNATTLELRIPPEKKRGWLDPVPAVYEQLIFLLDEYGGRVTGYRRVKKRISFFNFKLLEFEYCKNAEGWVSPGASVKETIEMLGKWAAEIRFIFWYRQWSDHHGAIILYKVPRGTLAESMTEMEIEAEALDFHNEIAAIDVKTIK